MIVARTVAIDPPPATNRASALMRGNDEAGLPSGDRNSPSVRCTGSASPRRSRTERPRRKSDISLWTICRVSSTGARRRVSVALESVTARGFRVRA
jgi:hypothetical protein